MNTTRVLFVTNGFVIAGLERNGADVMCVAIGPIMTALQGFQRTGVTCVRNECVGVLHSMHKEGLR